MQNRRWARGFLRGGTLVRAWVGLPNRHAILPQFASETRNKKQESYAEPRVGVTLAKTGVGAAGEGGHALLATQQAPRPDIRCIHPTSL